MGCSSCTAVCPRIARHTARIVPVGGAACASTAPVGIGTRRLCAHFRRRGRSAVGPVGIDIGVGVLVGHRTAGRRAPAAVGGGWFAVMVYQCTYLLDGGPVGDVGKRYIAFSGGDRTVCIRLRPTDGAHARGVGAVVHTATAATAPRTDLRKRDGAHTGHCTRVVALRPTGCRDGLDSEVRRVEYDIEDILVARG